MKLKYKLFWSILIIGVFTIVFGITTYYFLESKSVVESEMNIHNENVQYISKSIENDLLELVRLTSTLASSSVIRDSLVTSTEYYNSLTSSQRETIINDLNIT
ncbi:MAG: hypothetical protein JEZ05_09575 [Tenericutes bacterium]|nr:hypothetical protein [Mycoplasmatota bacterium]